MYNNEYFQNMSKENNIDGNNNHVNKDMDADANVSNGPSMNQPMPMGEATGTACSTKSVINGNFCT